MSDTSKAVFLSYASQDAEAAKRICEALRAAGVEVWFDQSELVGGDAWDQKIRKQIRECALLIPIISENTQSRTEGYFRLEWRLADQRTHLMGRSKAFLLPVAIDGTTDADADVPDSFIAVQWTKARGGEVSPAFCAQVKKLLGGEQGSSFAKASEDRAGSREQGAQAAAASGRQGQSTWRDPALQKKGPRWLKPVIGAAVVAVIALVISRPWEKKTPVAVVSEPISETAKVRARLIPDRWQKGDFEAIAPALDRIIAANPDDSDAWALRSIINSLQVLRNIDSGTKPLEIGRAAADRALRLAPDSPLAELALGMHLNTMISRGGDPRAGQPHMDRAVAGLPHDAFMRYFELVSVWQGYDAENAERVAKAWLAAEPKATYPSWILAQLCMVLRQPDDAEKWAEAAAADRNITGTRAIYTLFEAKYYLRANLTAAKAALARVPAEGRAVHRMVHARWLLAMVEHRWDEALQELAAMPEPMLYDRTFHGPRALLAGLAHQRAGRPDAALVQFHEAERLLRSELATDTDNEELHLVLAVTLACAGRAAEARSELALVEPLLRGRATSIYWGASVISIAQAYGTLGDFGSMTQWLRQLFTERNGFPFTPASLRLDPRFAGMLDAPEPQALLKEFASLDQPTKPRTEDGGQKTEIGLPIDQKSVAVLAFANLSDDKGNEYFSDGISEELLNVLAKIPGLKVAARTSAFYFKGKEVPIPEIAKQLGVAYVVEGSVRKSGDKVRITAQLIKAADGFHVWSDTFTRDLKDIFAVQDEIAGLIAKNLELKMGVVAARPVVDLEAYQEYLTGRAAAAKAGNADLQEAVGHFEKAVAIEPKFTAAWVQLASAHTQLGRWGGAPTLQAWAAARAAIDRARAIEPDSPEVLLALGWIQRTGEWDWRGAELSIRRSLQLRSNQPDALAGLAVLLFNIGKTEEAFRLGKQAAQLDPLNPATQVDLSLMFYFSKDNLVEAERSARRALQLAPGGAGFHSVLGWTLIAQRRYAEAEAEAHLDTDEIQRAAVLGVLAVARGQGEAARVQVARMDEIARTNGDRADLQQTIAWICAGLGEKDRAFAALEKARASRDPSISWLRSSPYLAPLFSDPRWDKLLHEVGLADDQLK